MLRTVLLLLILGWNALLPGAAQPSAAGTAAARTICELHLQGFVNRSGIKAAQLSCHHGSIAAAARADLRKALAGDGSNGVVWSRDAECQRQVDDESCLLAVCGKSNVTFKTPTITALKDPKGVTAVCVIQGSNVAFQNGTFSNSTNVRPIKVDGRMAAVDIINCTFTGNNVLPSKYGGALSIPQGTVVIQASRFTHNKAVAGGAIYAEGSAQISIMPNNQTGTGRNVFLDNFAEVMAGDIGVDGSVRLHMVQSTLSRGVAGNGGGAVALIGNSSATIINTVIVNATVAADGTDGGGCIATWGHSKLTLIGTTLEGCTAGDGDSSLKGGGIDANEWSMILLSNTSILSNTAGTRGGGVCLSDNSSIVLQGAFFTNNKASYGGGLALTGSATMAVRDSTMPTRFQGNRATDCGGGIFLDSYSAGNLSVHTQALSRQMAGNTAPRNADVCVAANKVEVLGSNSSLDNFIASLDSKAGLLYVTLRVTSAGGLPSDDPVQVVVTDSHNTTVSTQTVAAGLSSDSQGIRQVALRLRHPPGEYDLWFGIADDPYTKAARLHLRIAKCPTGYVTASTGDACISCVKGYFSFSPSDKECSMCVPNAQCPGGSAVWPLQGFWSSAPQSVQMHRCMNSAACLGGSAAANLSTSLGNDYKTAQCSAPYQGNLCGDCKPTYGKVRAFVCRKCLQAVTIVMLYSGAALAMVVLIKLMVYFSRSSKGCARPNLKQPVGEELLKVLILHGQWLYIMSNLVGIPWPSTLLYPLQVIGGIWSSTSGSSIGFDCILPRGGVIPVAIQKVLICLFTPVGILCVVLLLEAILHYFRPTTTSNVKHKLVSLVMSVVFLFLPTWVSTAFSLFTCVQLDRPATPPFEAEAYGTFWVQDMSQQCYSRNGYHRGWALGLGIPLTVMLCLMLPAGLFVFMWFSRKQCKLTQTVFERHYGFLYRLWREEVCWWEAVVVLQTIGLVMVATFGFALGPYYQGLVTAAVLGLVVMLLLWVRPFKCRAANTVAVQSACVLLLTVYAALTFLPYNNLEPGPVYSNAMGVVLLLLNLVFLSVAAWKLGRAVDWSAARTLVSRYLDSSSNVKLLSRRRTNEAGRGAGQARGDKNCESECVPGLPK